MKSGMGTRSRKILAAFVCSMAMGLLAVVGQAPAGAADGDLTAVLLKDVNTGTASSSPTSFVQVGSKVLFIASDTTSGQEWRVTDGTPGGTTVLKDLNPGATSSGPFVGNQPGVPGTATTAQVLGGYVFFAANDGSGIGTELWKTDGTAAGTTLVKDINPGAGSGLLTFAGPSGAASEFRVVGSTLFFSASDGVNGFELWKTDGTAAGTVLVKDILPGASTSFTSGANPQMAAVGTTLYFQGNNGTTGGELWKSDGTEGGTVLVKDIRPGSSGSQPGNFVDFNGTLYFGANDGTTGSEMWKSDGTAAGTTQVTDINPGSGSGGGPGSVIVGGAMIFAASDGTVDPAHGSELWKSDGTAAGTVMIKDFNTGTANGSPAGMTPFGGGVLFRATVPIDLSTGLGGTELWKTDGTEAGTVLVKEIATGGSTSSTPQNFAVVGSTAYFQATAGPFAPSGGVELWKSDGTAAGTKMVRDVNPGTASANPTQLTPALGNLFYSSTNGTTTGRQGVEPYYLRPNFAPVANADAYSTNEDTPLTVAAPGVQGNDADADGDAMTASLARTATDPVVTAASTTLTSASASFTAADTGALLTGGGLPAGTKIVTVVDATTVQMSNPATFSNSGFVLTITDQAQHGSLTFNANGSFTYTPTANYNGPDSFRYFLTDGAEDSRSSAIVSITVNAVNDVPVAGNDTATTTEDTPVTVNAPGVLGNDTDADGTALTAGSASTPANGSVTLNADGSYTYTPNANFNGSDSFTYKANDGAADSNVATVTVTVSAAADVPVAADDSATTAEDTPVTVAAPGVLGNDTDGDGDTLSAGSASTPANGSVTLNADGSYTYTPNANFNGSDSFTYTASDGTNTSNVATVTITVNAANDVPVAIDDSYATAANTPLNVAAPGVLGNDTDADGDSVTAGSASTPAHGSVTLNADGSFTYTPAFGYGGSDSFTYVASDGNGGTATATANITVSPPTGPTTFAVSDVSLNEGLSGTTAATFTITRSGTNSGTSTVKYKTANGTAVAPSDYAAKALTTLTFAPGEAVKTVTVDVVGDAFFEKAETFRLSLSYPSGASIADSNGVATIFNDDAAPTLSINDIQVSEGNTGTTNATFTITRSGNTAGAVSVKVKSANGSAIAASATVTPGDYVAVPLTAVSFADGQLSATVTVQVNGDTAYEKNETFKMALSSPVGGTITDFTGIGTILNDD